MKLKKPPKLNIKTRRDTKEKNKPYCETNHKSNFHEKTANGRASKATLHPPFSFSKQKPWLPMKFDILKNEEYKFQY